MERGGKQMGLEFCLKCWWRGYMYAVSRCRSITEWARREED